MICSLSDRIHQKVLSVWDRRGNQVRSLNDPVTVSGEAISMKTIAEGLEGKMERRA